jgi:hypothetical protein
MFFSSAAYVEFELSDELTVDFDEDQIGLYALSDRGIGEMLGDSFPVALTGQVSFEGWEVILAVGILDMAQELSSFAYHESAPAQEISGRSHFGGIDIGLGDHATTQKSSDLSSVDLVVFGLSPMYGFHVEGVSENEGDTFVGTEIGEPVPGEDTLDCDHKVFSVRRNCLEKGLGFGPEVTMEDHVSVTVEYAEIHGPGVEIDATIVVMLTGVESHEVSSLLIGSEVRAWSLVSSYLRVGASMSITA